MILKGLQLKCSGNSPALFQNCCVVLCIVCFVSFYVLFVCKCVLLPPGDNPLAVNKYIISYLRCEINLKGKLPIKIADILDVKWIMKQIKMWTE